jgi:hypothetical protein
MRGQQGSKGANAAIAGRRCNHRAAILIGCVLATACAASRDATAQRSRAPVEPANAGIVPPEPVAVGDVPGRAGWGVVAYREIGPARAHFVLEHAQCRRPPMPRGDVLDQAAVAPCHVRAWTGPVTVELREPGGRWIALEVVPTSDRDGRLDLDYADLDRWSLEHGHRELDAYAALRIGRGGWAGTYSLDRLRALQADLHARWVTGGRGAPGLFALRHPEHPRAAAATELAVEARLARQEADFAAVLRGELSPAAFLDRHAWSPLRVRVAAMLEATDQRSSPTAGASKSPASSEAVSSPGLGLRGGGDGGGGGS